jgi:hypothetical protein
VRTLRAVLATVALVIATQALLQSSFLVANGDGRDYGLASARWFATPDFSPLTDRLASLQEAYERDVARVLTTIDELGRFFEQQRAEAEGLAPSELLPVDRARWERLHVCEQPDTWYASGVNPGSESGMVFQGGLGMSVGAWQMAVRAAAARGVSLPRSALSASVYQQMVGAQAFYDSYGWGWGCRV